MSHSTQSIEASDTADDVKEPFTPPPSAWRFDAFIDASPEEIDAKTVTCGTCPVALSCLGSIGGTGWVCQTCRTTSVYVDTPDDSEKPNDILVLDCAKHQFDENSSSKDKNKLCALCSGGAMELDITKMKPTAHYVRTAYSKAPVEERQLKLRAARTHWQEVLTKKKPAK